MGTVSNYRSWVILALFFSTSCAIALSAYLHVLYPTERFTDGQKYMAMAAGDPDMEVPSPFRYRVLTPWVVRSLPSLGGLADNDARDLQLRFAVVNLVGLTLAAWWLFLWLEKLGFSRMEALVGGLLYLGSFQTLYTGALPYTDAWAHAFLVGGLLLLVEARWLWLALVFGVAIFEKEAILLLPAMGLFLRLGRRGLAKMGLAIAPGLAAYAWFRFVAMPNQEPSYWLFSVPKYAAEVFLTGEKTRGFLVIGVAVFGVFWFLAALGCRHARNHPVLGRLRWFLLILLPAPFLLVIGSPRFWFYSFPIIFPLALLGLQRTWGEEPDPPMTPPPGAAGSAAASGRPPGSLASPPSAPARVARSGLEAGNRRETRAGDALAPGGAPRVA